MKKVIPVFIFSYCLAAFSIAYALQPMETLKLPINDVLAILKDPQYKDAGKKSLQRDRIFETVRGLFDFPTITRLSLGKYRKTFTPEQLNDLIDTFTELLGKTYINKMLSEFKGEEIVYLSEDLLTIKKAIVKTLILRDPGDMAVNYRLRLHNGVWSVYDVSVDGISLVKNYRTQFSQILFKETPEALIEKLKKKIDENKAKFDATDAQ